jgi:hypothetical protein
MTRSRTAPLILAALCGALALSSCRKNPEASESHSPAASTDQTAAESSAPVETPPPANSPPADK